MGTATNHSIAPLLPSSYIFRRTERCNGSLRCSASAPRCRPRKLPMLRARPCLVAHPLQWARTSGWHGSGRQKAVKGNPCVEREQFFSSASAEISSKRCLRW
jgi:hypothetical protein